MNEEPKPIISTDSSVKENSNNQNKLRQKVWDAILTLSVFEKIVFCMAVFITILTGYFLLDNSYKQISTEVPTTGGILTEAATDYSRFINPILARSETDKDIAALIYSGLMKPDSNSELQNDLASSVTKSSDGLTYTVVLKDNLQFHDNQPLTADDVVFTIQKIKDPTIKSPLVGNWTGIDVKKIDNKTIQFTLPQAYEPFEQNLTVGILPAHLWASSSADAFDINPLNRKPVGSGPYKIESVKEAQAGVISEYRLTAFDKYALEQPYIRTYVFDMYQDEETAIKALTSGHADIISGISIENFRANKKDLLNGRTLYTPLLPRTFSLFFNQSNSPVLLNSEVRLALNQAIDKNDLIQKVRDGFATPDDSPIPGKITAIVATTTASSTTSPTGTSSVATSTPDVITLAQNTLTAKGWKKGHDGIFQKQVTLNKKNTTERLSFHISTSNSPELKAIAQYVAAAWKNIGAEVTVEIYESSDLAEKVVTPRKYDVLLFGQVVGRDWDLYPFWHSSQQKDLGLNLAMYANKRVDAALEILRATSTDSVRANAVDTITREINNDLPAIFLYSPQYLFIMPKSVQGVDLPSIENSSERFYQANKWYMNTKRILNAFNK